MAINWTRNHVWPLCARWFESIRSVVVVVSGAVQTTTRKLMPSLGFRHAVHFEVAGNFYGRRVVMPLGRILNRVSQLHERVKYAAASVVQSRLTDHGPRRRRHLLFRPRSERSERAHMCGDSTIGMASLPRLRVPFGSGTKWSEGIVHLKDNGMGDISLVSSPFYGEG